MDEEGVGVSVGEGEVVGGVATPAGGVDGGGVAIKVEMDGRTRGVGVGRL